MKHPTPKPPIHPFHPFHRFHRFSIAWLLAGKLLSPQKPDGSWANTSGRWMEKDFTLVTSYAVLALNTMNPAPSITGLREPVVYGPPLIV